MLVLACDAFHGPFLHLTISLIEALLIINYTQPKQMKGRYGYVVFTVIYITSFRDRICCLRQH